MKNVLNKIEDLSDDAFNAVLGVMVFIAIIVCHVGGVF